MFPDIDVLAFRFNVAYADEFGHRGASHSLAFALLAACLLMLFSSRLKSTPLKTFLFVAISTASHGILDTFTNGGKGVALLWPFSTERFFSYWQVIEVSPLSLRRIFSDRGLQVIQSEFIWVWLPAIVLCVVLIVVRSKLRIKYFVRAR
ncbi:putative membrane-bound metal-dependent hydrolase [Solimicrobium silvestre]|uniref:Putative membrane-bound metal-dependent hydrolase n=2 Tax=Solimicrobium silvestre TaxID=2099400 RepID=A0A2S9GSR7_9BURK|nr:putative membrane-bound metal-dependent hydrolase [Solimicrobium silvestre]